MRLLFLSNEFPSALKPTKGMFNLGLLRALADLNHDVAVVTPIAWTDWIRASKANRRGLRRHVGHWKSIPVTYPVYFYTPGTLRNAYGQFMWFGIKTAVRELIARQRPQAIISYWAHPDGHCAIQAAREAGIPAVVMVGGSDILLLHPNASRRRAIQAVLHRAHAVVTVSQDLQNKIVESSIERSKVHVVRRGVDTDRFFPGNQREARERLGLPVDRPILLWVGRMEQVKGLQVLLDGLQHLKRTGVNCQTLLVGSGSLSSAISRQIQQRNLSSIARMPGIVPHQNLADYYRAANLVVLPSLSEGVPNVLLEAMACGTPFVASNVGGIPEIATLGLDRLVPPGDPRALSSAIRECLDSPPAVAPRTFFPEDWPTAAGRLVDVIQRLVNPTPSRHSENAAICLHHSIA